MDRCDGMPWSDEEDFLVLTQGHVGGEPEAPKEEECKKTDVYEEESEEFGDLSWFEEETSLYLGRESLGCGDLVEQRSCPLRSTGQAKTT